MKKYIIDEKEVSEKEFYNQLESAVYTEVEEGFDDFIDEIYPEVTIGGISLNPSHVMKECARGDYNLWLGDEQSYRAEEAASEVDHRGEVDYNRTHFEIVEEDE